MAVEIKELIVRASVTNNTTAEQENDDSPDRQEIVRACVEQVLKILKREKER